MLLHVGGTRCLKFKAWGGGGGGELHVLKQNFILVSRHLCLNHA